MFFFFVPPYLLNAQIPNCILFLFHRWLWFHILFVLNLIWIKFRCFFTSVIAGCSYIPLQVVPLQWLYNFLSKPFLSLEQPCFKYFFVEVRTYFIMFRMFVFMRNCSIELFVNLSIKLSKKSWMYWKNQMNVSIHTCVCIIRWKLFLRFSDFPLLNL